MPSVSPLKNIIIPIDRRSCRDLTFSNLNYHCLTGGKGGSSPGDIGAMVNLTSLRFENQGYDMPSAAFQTIIALPSLASLHITIDDRSKVPSSLAVHSTKLTNLDLQFSQFRKATSVRPFYHMLFISYIRISQSHTIKFVEGFQAISQLKYCNCLVLQESAPSAARCLQGIVCRLISPHVIRAVQGSSGKAQIVSPCPCNILRLPRHE